MRCGCDVVDVARVSGVLDRRPAALTRIFSTGEVADAFRDGVGTDSVVARRRLAARWAAKEATIKALDRPDLGLTEIELRTSASGAPSLWIRGAPTDLAVATSHGVELAIAVVIDPNPSVHEEPTDAAV